MTTELLFNSPADPSTTLSGNGGSITAGATTLNVASAAGTSGSGQWRIRIGTEIMIATAGAGTTTWSGLTRGAEGTTAASHNDGDGVYLVLTAGALGNLAYATSPHASAAHSGSVFPVAAQTLQGDLGDSAADAHSIGSPNRFLLAAAKTLRTEDLVGAAASGGANGDIKVGTGKIWLRSGGTWYSVATTGGAAALPLANYLFDYDGANYNVTNMRTGSTDFTNSNARICWNQMVSVLSMLTNPGGKVFVAASASNAVYSFDSTAFTCPGMEVQGPGGGKRGAQNGRNVGTMFQAASGFVGSPMWSWVNQCLMQPPLTAPGGTATAGGSMTPGAHSFAYTWVANNGGESPLSPPFILTTTSGNATASLTFPALPSWAVSMNVYMSQADRRWAATTVYAVNDVVTQLAGADNGHEFVVNSVSGTGTSGGSEPTWNLAANGLTTDNAGANQVVWRENGSNIMRRNQGTMRNDQFYQCKTGVTGATTVTSSDTAAALSWNGVGKYRNQHVLFDQHGVPDYTHPNTPAVWVANTVYNLGDCVTAVVDNAHVFRCISPGGVGWTTNAIKSGAVEPTWVTTTDGVTLDNGLAWQECGASAAGTLAVGTYQWLVTATVSGTEREISPVSALTISSSAKKVSVGCPIGPAGTTDRKVYRTVTGGTTFKLVTTVANNTTVGIMDSTADGSLGATMGATLPTILPSPRESAGVVGLAMDCNGNGAGTQGAEVGWMVKGGGVGNAAYAQHVTVMNASVNALRLGWSGEDDASSDFWGDDLLLTTPTGTAGNVGGVCQVNCGDSAITRSNFANLQGKNVSYGLHIASGSANFRISNDTHIGGGGGGICNVLAESMNGFWDEECYHDNVTFASGSAWLRPKFNTSLNRYTMRDAIINHNADVPFMTFDGGKPSGSSGKAISWARIAGVKTPGFSSTKNSAMIVFRNGYPNGRGLSVESTHASSFRKDKLFDSTGNAGVTGVTADFEWGNVIDTAANSPANMLSEQWGTATFVASTAVTFNHNLRAAPTYVTATAQGAVARSFGWTATATQITLTADASTSVTVSWHAVVKG